MMSLRQHPLIGSDDLGIFNREISSQLNGLKFFNFG